MIYYGEKKMPDLCNRRYPFHFTTALNLLAAMGVDPLRVSILAVGEYENYKGEIRQQKPAPGGDLGPTTQIELEVGFKSAVDYMPYQFFYGLEGRSAGTEWEDHARHMMAPFDASVIRYFAQAGYEQLKYSFGLSDHEHIGRYLGLFDFLAEQKAVGVDNGSLWAMLMPTFHEWSGNPDRVGDILSRLFRHRIRIKENVAGRFEIPRDLRYHLGSTTGRLGRESLLGSEFTEYDSCYEVEVRDVTRDEVIDFLPGGLERKKLEVLLGVCMPSHLEYAIQVRVAERPTRLGKEGNGAYLGYATHV